MRLMSAIDWAGSKWFKPNEFQYPDKMSFNLIEMLNKIRAKAGVRMTITDDWRPSTQTIGVEDSEHETGEGVDIRASTSAERFAIVGAAIACGCTRIGVYNSHIHLGIAKNKPQYMLWLGVSK
jgi:hypothetical protein